MMRVLFVDRMVGFDGKRMQDTGQQDGQHTCRVGG
jgi:hypothetical protein